MKKKETKDITATTAESLREKIDKHYDESKGRELEQKQEEVPVSKKVESFSIIGKVMEHLFGRKYYAVVSFRTGTFMIGLCEHIFSSREEAKHLLDNNKSFKKLEIISFRSRNKYVCTIDDKGYRHTTIPNE